MENSITSALGISEDRRDEIAKKMADAIQEYTQNDAITKKHEGIELVVKLCEPQSITEAVFLGYMFSEILRATKEKLEALDWPANLSGIMSK